MFLLINSDSSSSNSEFDDGYDDNLMGDEDDRKRLNGLSEKERETEIFKRIEQRDLMRTRWEIERKLKLARRGEKGSKPKIKKDKRKKNKKLRKAKPTAKEQNAEAQSKKPVANAQVGSSIAQSSIQQEDGKQEEKQAAVAAVVTAEAPAANAAVPVTTTNSSSAAAAATADKDYSDDEHGDSSAVDYFDHKERSKERKKNVEMNKTDDKRSNAMALLKAKREGKAKRGKCKVILKTKWKSVVRLFKKFRQLP